MGLPVGIAMQFERRAGRGPLPGCQPWRTLRRHRPSDIAAAAANPSMIGASRRPLWCPSEPLVPTVLVGGSVGEGVVGVGEDEGAAGSAAT